MPPGNGDHDLTGKPNAGERKALLILLPLLLLIGAQAAASDKCSLQRNVIQTRAQLRDCDFRTVVVLPHVHELRQALMGGDAIQSERVPFPVIECSIIPGVSFNKSLFFQIMSDSANHLDTMPPCVRPALGREAVAYASFMALNHDIIPRYIIFLHGHVTSWHQDRPMYELLNEVSALLPSFTHSDGMYLSLNNIIQGDMEDCVWHRLTGSKKRRDLERMYVKYFEKYLGPLPEDLAHFCCAQFLVSRQRITDHPRQMWLDTLKYLLDEILQGTGHTNATELCSRAHGNKCARPSIFMGELWPHLLGARSPFECVSTRWRWGRLLPWGERWTRGAGTFVQSRPLPTELMQLVRLNISFGMPITC